MSGQQPFDLSELGTERRDEREDVLAAAGWLDATIDNAQVRPSAGFGDRVMAALADEPAPSPAGFLAPLRRLGFLAGFGASVRQAWRSVSSGRPVRVRVSALAYVLAVVLVGTSLAGVATIGLAGALGQLGPAPTQSTAPKTPGPTIAPDLTTLPSAESAPPTAGESDEPSESPDASDDHGGSGGLEPSDDHGGDGSVPEPIDDHGGTPQPTSVSGGSGSDDSGSGSGSGSSTPKPSDTPRPTGTPKLSETPH